MQFRHKTQPSGLWLVTGAAFLWGTIGPATQSIFNTDTTTPLFVNLMRMLIAAPVLLAVCWQVVGRAMFDIRRRDLGIMLLSGTLLAISQAAYFASIREAGVTVATLLTLCIIPLVVAGLSILLRFERLTQRLVIALVCALIGIVLLVGVESVGATGSGALLGAAFALVCALTYGGVVLCGRFLAGSYHSLQVTAVMFVAGVLALVPINLVSGVVVIHSVQGWLLVAYLGLVPTALAYWLFQMGLRLVLPTTATIVSMTEALVAAGLAWLFFGETLGVTGIAGAGLLVASIVLLSVQKRG